MKRCTIPLVFMEMKTISVMRYHCIPTKMTKRQNQKQANEKLILPNAKKDQSYWDSDAAGQACKMPQSLWKMGNFS